MMAKKTKAASGNLVTPPAVAAKSPLVSRDNAEHYNWGVDCDGWHLVRDANLAVIEEFMPPGAAEVRHYHGKAQQFFYILEGEVLMEVEGEKTLIPAGN